MAAGGSPRQTAAQRLQAAPPGDQAAPGQPPNGPAGAAAAAVPGHGLPSWPGAPPGWQPQGWWSGGQPQGEPGRPPEAPGAPGPAEAAARQAVASRTAAMASQQAASGSIPGVPSYASLPPAAPAASEATSSAGPTGAASQRHAARHPTEDVRAMEAETSQPQPPRPQLQPQLRPQTQAEGQAAWRAAAAARVAPPERGAQEGVSGVSGTPAAGAHRSPMGAPPAEQLARHAFAHAPGVSSSMVAPGAPSPLGPSGISAGAAAGHTPGHPPPHPSGPTALSAASPAAGTQGGGGRAPGRIQGVSATAQARATATRRQIRLSEQQDAIVRRVVEYWVAAASRAALAKGVQACEAEAEREAAGEALLRYKSNAVLLSDLEAFVAGDADSERLLTAHVVEEMLGSKGPKRPRKGDERGAGGGEAAKDDGVADTDVGGGETPPPKARDADGSPATSAEAPTADASPAVFDEASRATASSPPSAEAPDAIDTFRAALSRRLVSFSTLRASAFSKLRRAVEAEEVYQRRRLRAARLEAQAAGPHPKPVEASTSNGAAAGLVSAPSEASSVPPSLPPPPLAVLRGLPDGRELLLQAAKRLGVCISTVDTPQPLSRAAAGADLPTLGRLSAAPGTRHLRARRGLQASLPDVFPEAAACGGEDGESTSALAAGKGMSAEPDPASVVGPPSASRKRAKSGEGAQGEPRFGDGDPPRPLSARDLMTVCRDPLLL